MDDLIIWLRAQLDEDEQTALVAIEGPWRVEPMRDFHFGVVSSETGFEGEDDQLAITNLQTDAEHICRHDPARVLREVVAKREIITVCAAAIGGNVNPGAMGNAEFILQLMGVPYSDRSGYCEEWRP